MESKKGVDILEESMGSSSPTDNIQHELKKLPVWAQNQFRRLWNENHDLRRHIQTMEEMHHIFGDSKCSWSGINYSDQLTRDGFSGLWVFSKNLPVRIFSIYEGDRVFVGRTVKDDDGQQNLP